MSRSLSIMRTQNTVFWRLLRFGPLLLWPVLTVCVPLNYPWFIENPEDIDSACLATRRMYYNDALFAFRRRPSGNFSGIYLADRRRNPGITAFVSERTSYGNNRSTSVLDDALQRIEALGGVTADTLQSRNFGNSPDTTNRDFILTLAEPRALIRLTNQILRAVGPVNAGNPVGNLLSAGGNDDEYDSVRLSLTSQFYNTGRVLVFATLVPEADVEEWLANTDLFGDGSNVGDCDSPFNSARQSFNVRAIPPVDFLWIVDNSSSMSFFQSELAGVADVFTDALTNAGFSYRLGVITTDNEYEESVPVTTAFNTNAFVSDTDEFTDRVLSVGTLGSVYESGIYSAVYGLQSISEGDNFDGPITAAGYPRDGAGFSIIVLSDELDYYNHYAGLYGDPDFDRTNNLIVDRGFIFNGIVDTSYSNDRYNRLIRDTGGVAADIFGGNFAPAMQSIVANYVSTVEGYRLKRRPLSSTITVRINGKRIPNSRTNGWTYNRATNSISFFGSALPSGSDKIKVTYIYATSEQ